MVRASSARYLTNGKGPPDGVPISGAASFITSSETCPSLARVTMDHWPTYTRSTDKGTKQKSILSKSLGYSPLSMGWIEIRLCRLRVGDSSPIARQGGELTRRFSSETPFQKHQKGDRMFCPVRYHPKFCRTWPLYDRTSRKFLTSAYLLWIHLLVDCVSQSNRIA